ncbi:MAG: heme-binding domain-containing protein [Bacteroidota bacterium]|nr:heme-binding domain-containing protein [Bacteroidota bacterium]
MIIQFFRPEKNSGNAESPNDIAHFTAVSPELKNILETSCNNCHSDHTEYPWYTNIQPVGWWLNDHVKEGTDELNFSQFNTYRVKRKMKKFHEIAEQVEEKEMPLNTYLWMHGNAKLNESQAKLLVNWAKENEKLLMEQYPDSINTK